MGGRDSLWSYSLDVLDWNLLKWSQERGWRKRDWMQLPK